MSSDTCKGAEDLTELYSLYKTCIVNSTDFKFYMKKIIETMTLHMNEIEFEKDKRGTITDFKSHNISSDVLDKLMPWNMNKVIGYFLPITFFRKIIISKIDRPPTTNA